MTSSTQRAPVVPWAALACAFTGITLFQVFGNATRGYVDTASLFYWWGFQWFNPASEMEHGPLILALCGWLLWRNLARGEGREAEGETAWPAFAAMAAGLALHALGFIAQQTRVSIVGFLVFAWGVLRLGGGRKWGAAAAFPLVFLVFAIPFNVLDSVGFWLRLWVIKASAGIAHAAGIGVLQSGTQLLAPDGRYNYDVAAACSGIRSLTALAALALLTGYLNFRHWGRRALVFVLCFPLVYAGNVARITSIIFAAQWGGQAWGEHAHTVMGYGVFIVVLGGVLAAVAALQRWRPEPQAAGDGRRETGDRRQETEVAGRWSLVSGRAAAFVAAAVVALAVGEMFFLHHLAAQPPRGAAGVRLADGGKDPVELPAFLGTEWIGRRVAVSDVERTILPADTGFSRRLYVSVANPAQQVLVSIVLSGRDRTSIHRPELCLVGQGWTIAGAAEHTFAYPGRPEGAFPVTLLRVRREVAAPATTGRAAGPLVVPQLVAYWFVNADSVVATHWGRFAADAWHRVAHGRADRWAYVLVQTDARDGEAAALGRIQAVLNEALPVFQQPMPKR